MKRIRNTLPLKSYCSFSLLEVLSYLRSWVELNIANVRRDVVMGSYIAVVITMEECLSLTSEDICFKYADPYNDGCRITERDVIISRDYSPKLPSLSDNAFLARVG